MDLSMLSYQKFVDVALEETRLHTTLTSLQLQEHFKHKKVRDDNAILNMVSFKAPKIRLLRSLTIEDRKKMQVLDLAILPEPTYDLPIFCANFFTSINQSIVVLDLNPLYDVTINQEYKKKYYGNLFSLHDKYAEFLPWGDELTSESLRFFSPIVIWSKFSTSHEKHCVLLTAFLDYIKSWLALMDEAVEEGNASKIQVNREAQHRYLTWRAEKDPGFPLLSKLFGEDLARDLVRQFLFEGVDSLGTKTFLDFFPEYRRKDGSIERKRSIVGKSFKTRPWDANGEFTASVMGL